MARAPAIGDVLSAGGWVLAFPVFALAALAAEVGAGCGLAHVRVAGGNLDGKVHGGVVLLQHPEIVAVHLGGAERASASSKKHHHQRQCGGQRK